MTQFPQLVVNILLTRLASDQRLPSSVHCSREFLMTKHHLSSNPRRQSVPESQAHRKHPVERAQEWGLHRRQKRLLWGIRAAFWPRPSGHKAPADRRDPPLGGRQGEGAEALAAGASLGTKETAGRRPQEPICARQPLELRLQTCSSPPPPHPGPPARPPFCLLSPSVLAGPGPFPGSGYSVLIRAGGAGAGGCGGAACCARVGLPPPLSLALARRPAPSSGPERCPLDFAPRRALLLLRAGPCSVQAAAGKPEAKCSPDPRPTWLKSPSTSPSCRESRKVGAGPWSARRAPPAPSAGSLPREEGLPSLGGPRGLRLAPTGCRPAVAGKKLNSGSAAGPWASHLSSEPVFLHRREMGGEANTTLIKWLCKGSPE